MPDKGANRKATQRNTTATTKKRLEATCTTPKRGAQHALLQKKNKLPQRRLNNLLSGYPRFTGTLGCYTFCAGEKRQIRKAIMQEYTSTATNAPSLARTATTNLHDPILAQHDLDPSPDGESSLLHKKSPLQMHHCTVTHPGALHRAATTPLHTYTMYGKAPQKARATNKARSYKRLQQKWATQHVGAHTCAAFGPPIGIFIRAPGNLSGSMSNCTWLAVASAASCCSFRGNGRAIAHLDAAGRETGQQSCAYPITLCTASTSTSEAPRPAALAGAAGGVVVAAFAAAAAAAKAVETSVRPLMWPQWIGHAAAAAAVATDSVLQATLLLLHVSSEGRREAVDVVDIPAVALLHPPPPAFAAGGIGLR
ncbi:hypothetical protein cyc_04985 [Cyclospora cayetanensis]|uniref:Uncharacterized protein n=1 Tax=Cyclospora cayetanensis TaxID=88456 RepID=A0A1D3CTC4_9EIME|nr:hypothetical protein cyc_04985 [Cyclospora cayetanensis]